MIAACRYSGTIKVGFDKAADISSEKMVLKDATDTPSSSAAPMAELDRILLQSLIPIKLSEDLGLANLLKKWLRTFTRTHWDWWPLEPVKHRWVKDMFVSFGIM